MRFQSVKNIIKIKVKEKIGKFKYLEEVKVKEEYGNIIRKLDLKINNLCNKEVDLQK